MEYVIQGNIRQGNVRSGRCHSGNCPLRKYLFGELSFGKMSIQGEYPLTYLLGNISLGWGIAHSEKYLSGSCPSGICFRGTVRRGNVCRRKVHRGNVPSVNCPRTLKVWSQKPLLLKISYILIYFKKLYLRACFYSHMEQYVPRKQVKK